MAHSRKCNLYKQLWGDIECFDFSVRLSVCGLFLRIFLSADLKSCASHQ